MPILLAIVESATEARNAAAAGAGRVALRCAPDSAELASLRQDLTVPLSLMAAEPSRVDLWVAALRASGADDLRWPAEAPIPSLPGDLGPMTLTAVVSIERPPEPSLCKALAALGFDGILLAAPPGSTLHLTECLDSSSLSMIVADARRHGLSIGLSGALEAPDVSRLMALAPDEIAFEVMPGFAERLITMRQLMAGAAGAPVRLEADEPDRIFVRDWVFSMSIGAYRRERGTPQRVRLSVEAETSSRGRSAVDLRDVVSYDLITDTVRRLAAIHVDLVETFAEAIAEALLAQPGLARVTVTVEKLDLGAGAVGCRIVRRRAN